MSAQRQPRVRPNDHGEVGMRQKVKRSGLVFTITIVIVGLAAFASANNLLFLLLAAMLSTLLIYNLISRLGLAGLELDLSLPDHLIARETIYGRVALRNTKRWMTSFSIHLSGASGSGLIENHYFPVLPAGHTLQEQATFFFPHRGRYQDRAFRVSSQFPFGFTEREVPVLVRREVLVYPSLSPVPALESFLSHVAQQAIGARSGRGDDFYRLRPYEYSDSTRNVDWKVSAHVGQLQIREFAEEQERRIELFLDRDRDAPSEWFEQAIECCAFLAVYLHQRGGQVRLRTQSEEAAEIDTILKVLALVEQTRETPAAPPQDAHIFPILFTARPDEFAQHGWSGAMLLTPGVLASLGPDAHSPGTASPSTPNDDHRRR